MFASALRAAARPAVFAARASFKPATAARAFSVTARARSGAPAPQIYGEGGKAGQVPTDFEQATGLERLQLLGEMEGIDIFADEVDTTRIGTLADPIKINSYAPERLVGCTGFPADSHEVTWFTLTNKEHQRCVECGSVFAMDFKGEEHDDHHHH